MSSVVLVGAFVVALTSVAGARPYVAYEPEMPPEPPRVEKPDPWRLQGAMGVRFGSFLIDGHSTGTAIPFHFDAGFRKARWLVYAEYNLLSLTVAMREVATAHGGTLTLGGSSGLMHRGAANLRWIFGRAADKDGGAEVWAETGVGMQHFRWDEGGVWTRPDVSFGAGATMLGMNKRRHGGLSIGIRVTLARRSENAGGDPTCGGPCDYATRPTGLDRSVLFDMTVLFGR